MRSQATRAVGFTQELTNQGSGAISLVLINEGGCLVEVLRAISIPTGDRCPREICRVIGTTRTDAADGNAPITTLHNEVEAVVEILGKGHPEQVRLSAGESLRLLGRHTVGNLAGVEPSEDRVDLSGARGGVNSAESRFSETNERFVRCTEGGIGAIVLSTSQITNTNRIGILGIETLWGNPTH